MSKHDNDDAQDFVRGGHLEKLQGGSARKPARLEYTDDIPAPGHDTVLDEVIARERVMLRNKARRAENASFSRNNSGVKSGHDDNEPYVHELPLDVELARYEEEITQANKGSTTAAGDEDTSHNLAGKAEHRLRKANGGKEKLTAEQRRKRHLNAPDGAHHSR